MNENTQNVSAQNKSDRRRITGLFRKESQAGRAYFKGEGEIGGKKVAFQMFENTDKLSDNSPDFTLYEVPVFIPKAKDGVTSNVSAPVQAKTTKSVAKPVQKAEEVDEFV